MCAFGALSKTFLILSFGFAFCALSFKFDAAELPVSHAEENQISGAKMKDLDMFPAKDNQISSYSHQKESNNYQIDICFHDSFPPLNEKVNRQNKQTTHNCSKKVSIGNIPFNHDSASSINPREETIDMSVIINEAIKVNEKSEKPLEGCVSKGETTPTVNQATAIFPKICDNLSNCPEDNFITRRSVSWS